LAVIRAVITALITAKWRQNVQVVAPPGSTVPNAVAWRDVIL
jgi:hypothetical protein